MKCFAVGTGRLSEVTRYAACDLKAERESSVGAVGEQTGKISQQFSQSATETTVAGSVGVWKGCLRSRAMTLP